MQNNLDLKKNDGYLFNIIIPLFNAEKYIENCLKSIIKQSYIKYQVKIVDDCSTDDSFEIASSICSQHKQCSIIRNSRRVGALKNIHDLLCNKIEEPPKTVDILIDGDDYLYSGDVLNIINEKYLKTNCLVTYGSHLSSNGVQGKKYPYLIREFNLYRKYFWYASHLKTFRHDLWMSIRPNDLLDKNGEYFKVAWDLAIMFPLLEMAGKRQEFVNEVLYVYNDQNPLNDYKIRRKDQILAAKEIRRKVKYRRINLI